MSGNFYRAVAHAVLLFGAENWVLTPRMERALDSFQHRVASSITGKQPRQRADEIWEYPSLVEALGEAGFEGIRKSVTRRQNTVAQYIATQPIMDLCERTTWWPVSGVSRRWWEQAGIDLEGAKKRRRRQQQYRSKIRSQSRSRRRSRSQRRSRRRIWRRIWRRSRRRSRMWNRTRTRA